MARQRVRRTENSTLKDIRSSALSHYIQGAFSLLRSLVFLCGSPLLLAGGSSATVAQTSGLALRARHAILETAELASRGQRVQRGNQDQSSACAGTQHVGTSLEKLGEREASLAAFRRSIGIDPSNAEAHYNLGTALGEFGNLQEAVAELGQARDSQG